MQNINSLWALAAALCSMFLTGCASNGSDQEAEFSRDIMVTYTLNNGEGWKKVNAGLEGWGDGVADFTLVNEQANVQIKKLASQLWHIQLKRPLYLVEDMKYEITVEASATEPSEVAFSVQENGDDYTTYFQRTEMLGVESKHYHYEFVMPQDEKKAVFAIMFGEGQPGVSYKLSDIKFNSSY
ncbi:carbohydrate binding domain-containing protein [Agarivorans aestuarii]|uniref:Carbohydrate binding domain-containing protein n=1 Tax=Agarivorans aestuarii TaxID=1563703 RepID=A0ABU7G835_9ALTE|nr:carbohydrate binding domain-containing protein [Agarivorans aestuarii]MEE1674605.1 carbohydrate binding domain-containing protein [Agarivorans aestuarii]